MPSDGLVEIGRFSVLLAMADFIYGRAKSHRVAWMMPNIPPELVHAIIDEVRDSCLTTCASTARAFLHPSRRRIYGRINLYGPYPPNDRRFDYLCAMLSETMHLAPYIRSVVVCLDLARFQRMTHLLRAYTKLESLAIRFTAQMTCLDLPHLPLKFMDALLFRVASDSLPRLEIWGQAGLLMPDFLLHFALGSVRTLALRRITITQAPEGQARFLMARYHNRSTAAHLEHLTLDLLGRACISAARLVEYKRFGFLEGLQKLTLVQWSDRFVPLLEAAAPTLQEFRVDLAAALWQGDTVLPPFPALRVHLRRVAHLEGDFSA
ncbi:hypothetical protein B0H14DRAFT_3854637 [Mycena olivaceomarginata]|nr:hypothetical protein B0H14DRAFT_3854881 [Mycena olivaceomarginata]KAJ7893180.1 hypothetical protein B0H14DRAFT_3854637 [Mycena olivaceomarginata]